ncbi:MAG: hypothetical protein OEZ39_04065 [Gammaproteobacteria bacterium]|nr:hypothetical protein [Gammaproteobacteria bacterium]MDH5651033.1 hypothetical protein [Gammaproteobacteria bacterium]
MNSPHIPESQLHAYVDGQLDTHERAEVLDATRTDAELARQLAELNRLKELVRLAYQNPPPPRQLPHSRPARLSRSGQAIAASCLLTLGLVAGWWAHTPAPGPGFQELSQLDQPIPPGDRVLLHISKMDTQRITHALDKAERLLQNSVQQHRPLQLEIVANAEGLGMLREDSPFGDRIRTMRQQHTNVRFLACGIAMENARLKEGREPKLLPEANKINAALEQILGRLKEGWIYVKG